MPINTLVFDNDCTLTRPTMGYMLGTVRYAAHKQGKDVTDEMCRMFWYVHDRKRTITKVMGLEYDRFWIDFRENDTVEKRARNTIKYPDVQALKHLKQRGFKLGIVSGAPPEMLKISLSMLPVTFGAIVIANHHFGHQDKPHPSSLQEVLERLGTTPQEAVYIGNSSEDILLAQNADVLDIWIDRNEYPLDGIAPSITIESLYGLHDILVDP